MLCVTLNTNKGKNLRYANDFTGSKILNDFIRCIARLNEKVFIDFLTNIQVRIFFNQCKKR